MKKPLKEINTGDSMFLYEWIGGSVEREVEYLVQHIKKEGGGSVELTLADVEGNKKNYAFLDKDLLVTTRPVTKEPVLLSVETTEMRLRKENVRMRKALEFYADEENYKRRESDFTIGYPEEVLMDDGSIARKALEEIN